MSRMNERHLAPRGLPRHPEPASPFRSLAGTVLWIIGTAFGRLLGLAFKGQAAERTPEEVIALLYRYGQHVGDLDLDWSDWDHFLSTPIKDPGLERIRLECGDLTYEVDEIFARKIITLAEHLEEGTAS